MNKTSRKLKISDISNLLKDMCQTNQNSVAPVWVSNKPQPVNQIVKPSKLLTIKNIKSKSI